MIVHLAKHSISATKKVPLCPMLVAFPTTHGTGVTLYGDPGDLSSLHFTLLKMSGLNGRKDWVAQSEMLSNYAYSIKSAARGDCVKRTIQVADVPVKAYGINFLWTEVLFTIALCEEGRSWNLADAVDHVNLLLLRTQLFHAMNAYDVVGAKQLQHFIGQRMDMRCATIKGVTSHINFLYLTLPLGKRRFRTIVDLLCRFLSTWTEDRKQLDAHIAVKALEENCDPAEIEFLIDLDKVKW